MAIAPQRCSSSARVGAIHRWSTISPPSICTWVDGSTRPNRVQVENRLGASGPGVQCAIGCRSSASTKTPASSAVSRTAARRAAARPNASGLSFSVSSASPGSTRPPGNTHAPAANDVVAARLSNKTSRPNCPSRARTAVAAGISGGGSPPGLSVRCQACGIEGPRCVTLIYLARVRTATSRAASAGYPGMTIQRKTETHAMPCRSTTTRRIRVTSSCHTAGAHPASRSHSIARVDAKLCMCALRGATNTVTSEDFS